MQVGPDLTIGPKQGVLADLCSNGWKAVTIAQGKWS